MNLKDILEALPDAGEAAIKQSSKYSGTDDATKVDWKSGGGPETNLGKRAQKKKKKSYTSKFKINPKGFAERSTVVPYGRKSIKTEALEEANWKDAVSAGMVPISSVLLSGVKDEKLLKTRKYLSRILSQKLEKLLKQDFSSKTELNYLKRDWKNYVDNMFQKRSEELNRVNKQKIYTIGTKALQSPRTHNNYKK